MKVKIERLEPWHGEESKYIWVAEHRGQDMAHSMGFGYSTAWNAKRGFMRFARKIWFIHAILNVNFEVIK